MAPEEVLVKALGDGPQGHPRSRHPAGNLKEWLDPGHERSYLVKPRLTMVGHFDLDPAFLIRDSVSGTLGIVELVLPEKTIKPGQSLDVVAQVRKHVDAATYARHLLLRAQAKDAAIVSLTVELVP